MHTGTFELGARRQMLIHYIHGASFPNWIGADRELFFEFKDNRLTLMTLPMPLAGEQAVGYLTWERVARVHFSLGQVLFGE